jgi:PAS domain S-box-containing protein
MSEEPMISAVELEELRQRLYEAEETLAAIHTGLVDAVVVDSGEGSRVYALEGADYPYRLVLNSMHEGVLTITADRLIVYCNQRFSALLALPPKGIVGQHLGEFLVGKPLELINQMLEAAHNGPQVAEFDLLAHDGQTVPARLSVTAFAVGDIPMYSVLVTDLTERREVERQLAEYRERLQGLVAELTLTEGRERQSIATAIHDSIGQTLAAIRMKLGIMRSHIEDESLVQELAGLNDLLATAIAESRSLTFDLSPPMLYLVGLVPAINWLAEDMARKWGFAVSVKDEREPLPLSDEQKLMLYHSVRELLTNVAKHAEATAVTITISRNDGSIAIEVADNGKGFDSQAAHRNSPSASFGLFSVHERLTHIGGSFEIESSPGAGSRFVLTAPLTTQE